MGEAAIGVANNMRGETRSLVWTDSGWDSFEVRDLDTIRDLIRNPSDVVWVDVIGDNEYIRETFTALRAGCEPLLELDPDRATEGGENPPQRPPKAKAFRTCVFARAYWLGDPLPAEGPGLIAQELHLIAGPTFAVTLRYTGRIWRLDEMSRQQSPDPYHSATVGLNHGVIREAFAEYSTRRNPTGQGSFGLELAAVILDRVIDSLSESLNQLRGHADDIEHDILIGIEEGEKRVGKRPPEGRILGLRKLLRQVRWAFMPADEISEFSMGPFFGIETQGGELAFRLRDLEREATRALESAKDVAEQVANTVELRHTLKTDRLNSTIYVLTSVATVLLVPTLITSFYGMNFRHIPLSNWPLGFWAVLVGVAAVGLGLWLYIRRSLRGS